VLPPPGRTGWPDSRSSCRQVVPNRPGRRSPLRSGRTSCRTSPAATTVPAGESRSAVEDNDFPCPTLQPVGVSHMPQAVEVAAGVVLLGMLAFESVKSLIFPGVASWHSPWLTISFSTLVATAVTAAAVGRMQRLNGREAVWLNQELLHDALTGLHAVPQPDRACPAAAGAPSPIGGGTAALLLDMDRVTTIIDRLGHMSGTAFCARSPIACGLARVPATRLSGYFAHRITNAAAEGLNARIQANQGLRPRVPPPRALQARHLLPLRRPRPLPRHPLHSRMSPDLIAIWPSGPARSRAEPRSLEWMKLTAGAVRTFRPGLFSVLVQTRDNSRGIT